MVMQAVLSTVFLIVPLALMNGDSTERVWLVIVIFSEASNPF